MFRIHRVIFPATLFLLGAVFLVLGSLLISFGAENKSRVMSNAPLPTDPPPTNTTTEEGPGRLDSPQRESKHYRREKPRPPYLKDRFRDLPVEDRCAKVNWTEEKPRDFIYLDYYPDEWACVKDYEAKVQLHYTVLGVCFSVLAPMTCCLGGLHFFFDFRRDSDASGANRSSPPAPMMRGKSLVGGPRIGAPLEENNRHSAAAAADQLFSSYKY